MAAPEFSKRGAVRVETSSLGGPTIFQKSAHDAGSIYCPQYGALGPGDQAFIIGISPPVELPVNADDELLF